ncbi:MAG: sigma-54 dependent transcriptional regulator [Pseudomonadota bacterium]
MSRTVLLIEDTISLQMVYAAVLRNAGFEVQTAATAQEGWEAFCAAPPRAVLLDLMLPDRDGLELMRDMLDHAPGTCVVVVTANGSINRAVQAIRAGAQEFLVKPFDEGRMLNAIRNATREPASAGGAPAPGDGLPQPVSFAGFIGSSPIMQDLYAKVRAVASSMATIFLSGESGTGKEVCAQAVHDSSSRASGPLVPVNCGAIPQELMESELFGHLKGSFTGAISDKLGAAAAADGGTLFLDEICEMNIALQTKLLRFLQTSTIQPVGAVQPRKINVRIICATNRDPFEEVRRGRFRQDLFYRLHVVPLHLPPLRARGEDVIEIAEAMLARYAAEENKSLSRLDAEVRALFLDHPWPGNVRQLLNTMRNIVVLHDGDVVTYDMLPRALLADLPPNGHHARDLRAANGPARPAVPVRNPLEPLLGKTLAEIERIVIEETIERCGGSVPKAARSLDVSPSTIYRKREAWGEAPRKTRHQV